MCQVSLKTIRRPLHESKKFSNRVKYKRFYDMSCHKDFTDGEYSEERRSEVIMKRMNDYCKRSEKSDFLRSSKRVENG